MGKSSTDVLQCIACSKFKKRTGVSGQLLSRCELSKAKLKHICSVAAVAKEALLLMDVYLLTEKTQDSRR